MTTPAYIELHARSAFSFLRGAALPEQLAAAAANLGLPALAVCDRMGVYGAPRLFSAAREAGVRPIIGSELILEDGSVLPVLVESRAGYRHLCQMLTRAHLRAPKGEGTVRWEELAEFAGGLVALTGDDEGPLRRALTGTPTAVRAPVPAPAEILQRLVAAFGPQNVFVEIQRHLLRDEHTVNRQLLDLARAHRLPLLATNGPLHTDTLGRQVLDVFTCLRHHTHLDAAGTLLAVNSERHLKTAPQMAALFADQPDALANTVRLAERLQFTLADLGYEFPRFPVGPGETMPGVLRAQTYAGARLRYPKGVPEKVRLLLEKELALISKLAFDGYFLIVADLVRFCRDNDILAQGRGSAANSAVCFCLGITAVDPVKFNVLFERFLSEGRKGWPDIDIDLPSGERRERVIQEVYRRYGQHGAAMTATVITYRGRSAARELGKVLNLPADVLDRFTHLFPHGDFPHTLELLAQMEQAGLPRTHPRASSFASLYQQMSRLPRHLGQHTGGMIICQGELSSLMPLENAAMPGRVVAQWDKDDCEDLGIIKVDLLGLGMMSAIQDTLRLAAERNRPVDLAQLPEQDPETFALLQRAETIGVFQVESRAQMATLPRMKPKIFYDIVIEVALIRPGPIQGDLAHPYLRRRTGEEAVAYYDERLVPVLERTLGVPLFQEQMLQIAMVIANFTGDEAEELRRALSFHRSEEKMARVTARLRAAMDRNGVQAEVADKIVKAVGGFALYGFPESHAISFALLAYASAWLKVHRAAEFFCALLNNQPMGFYAPDTLLKDARRRGLRVRPVCVAESDWDCRIEADGALRLGLRQVEGLRRDHGEALLAARAQRRFASLDDLKARTRFTKPELRTLAEIGALNCLAAHRRAALWEAESTLREGELFTADGSRRREEADSGVVRDAPVARDEAERRASLGTNPAEPFVPSNARRSGEGRGVPEPGSRRGDEADSAVLRDEPLARDEAERRASLGTNPAEPFVPSNARRSGEGRGRPARDDAEPLRSGGGDPAKAWEMPSSGGRQRDAADDSRAAGDPPPHVGGYGRGGLEASPLRRMNPVERLQADYSGLGLTTGPHPMAFVREHLPKVWCANELAEARNGDLVRIAGLVICRQRPGTAKGTCFVSLEDETGISNAIVNADLFEAERLTITMEPFLLIEGRVQSRHGTIHIKALRIERLAFAELQANVSHDFH
ncbi:error-prone DNA polymerase [Verrucomicrobiota bacterium]|nr:error-prone DNA polymerase [Verrucomicrobiota bacterium]